MDNAKQQNVISVNSQVMELQQLIAGPLVSTIEADTLSSRRYLEMLQLIAFEDVTEGDRNIRRLRTLKFAYQETNVNGYRNKVVSIPLVNFYPFPFCRSRRQTSILTSTSSMLSHRVLLSHLTTARARLSRTTKTDVRSGCVPLLLPRAAQAPIPIKASNSCLPT